MSVQVKVETLEHNMAKLTVTVPAETFDKGITQAYLKMRNQISIPGFRKGKVPQAMVEKMYGPEMFYEEATNIILPSTYDEALTEVKDVNITSAPKIEFVQIGKGKEFIYTAEVATMPEAELGQYKGIEIEQEAPEVTDDEIAEEIRKAQNVNAREISVDREAKTGDITVIDYTGETEGVEFDGGKATDYSLTLGSGNFIPGFEDQLVGVKTGDELDVNVTFPEDYFNQDMAGKPAVFHVKVNDVREKELPALDDDFAQDVSEFDTFDEYREDVKKNLLEKKKESIKSATQQKVVDKIIENATMDIPDPMVETQAREMVDRYGQQLQTNGLNLQLYLNVTGMSMDDFVNQMKPQALKNIQSRIALKAVAKAEGIEASQEEIDAEFAKIAEQYNMDADKIKKLLPKEEIDTVSDDVISQKALDFAVENAVITTVEKAAEEKVEAKVDEPEA